MYKILSNKIFIALIGLLLFSGCGGESKKDDFDLSGFIKPIQKAPQNIEKSLETSIEKKEVEVKLKLLEDRKDISNSIKYGKKDPFSASDNESNKFIDHFKLKGFISFENKDYALVEYKNKKEIINLDSVGGINTSILPNKAFVKDINPLNEKIKLSIEGEIYTIKLNI